MDRWMDGWIDGWMDGNSITNTRSTSMDIHICTTAWSHEPINCSFLGLYNLTSNLPHMCYHGTSQLHHSEIGLSVRFTLPWDWGV